MLWQIKSASMGDVRASDWALVLAISPHRRSLELVYTAAVSDMAFAIEGLLTSSGDPLFTYHASDLL